ncbi:hypothetical protein K432DRAFT_44516 [Lepidopterella palustris CBS 459.81]|uniref:Transmembrane protein n=1 Tax=Lepidopterella palustris CBS 459.81 TaxID=1314670 RepID=A0A8E2JFB3_9PEZI|nr:hypothetical protein K432DRAFT_44516 [Lepidopterella palustris CBS 459.81]
MANAGRGGRDSTHSGSGSFLTGLCGALLISLFLSHTPPLSFYKTKSAGWSHARVLRPLFSRWHICYTVIFVSSRSYSLCFAFFGLPLLLHIPCSLRVALSMFFLCLFDFFWLLHFWRHICAFALEYVLNKVGGKWLAWLSFWSNLV